MGVAGWVAVAEGKKLECGKEVSPCEGGGGREEPSNHSSPALPSALCFCLILLPYFLTFPAWQMTDGGRIRGRTGDLSTGEDRREGVGDFL